MTVGIYPMRPITGLTPAMARITAILGALFILPLPASAARQAVSVARVASASVAGRQLYSSTRLLVTWTASPADQAHHFEITGRESVQGTTVRASVAAGATSAMLSGFKSNTAYSITVT